MNTRDAAPPSFPQKAKGSWETLVNGKREQEACIYRCVTTCVDWLYASIEQPVLTRYVFRGVSAGRDREIKTD